jgi:MFS superfamily sulfate permease-like transporter
MVVAIDDGIDRGHAPAPWIRIDPERDRVRVRCGGALDGVAAAQLREECAGLMERGFARVILDMTETTDIVPGVVSAIAAVNRRARTRGCRLSVAPGHGGAADALRRAGLLGQVELEGASRTFLDWTR